MVTEKNENFIKKVSKYLFKKSNNLSHEKSLKKIIKPVTSVLMGFLCLFSSGKFSKTSAISNDIKSYTKTQNGFTITLTTGSLKYNADTRIFSRERCFSKKFSNKDRKNITFKPPLDIEELPNLKTLNEALNRSYIGGSFNKFCHRNSIYAISLEDVEQIRKAVAPRGSKADKTKKIIPEIIENLEDPYLQLKEHQFLPSSTNVLLLKELNPKVYEDYENNETPITEDIRKNSIKQAFYDIQIIDDNTIIAASKKYAKLIQKTVASEDERDLISIPELKSIGSKYDFDFIDCGKLLPPSTKIFYGKNVPSKEKLELLNKFEKDIPRINEIIKSSISMSSGSDNSVDCIYVKNYEEEELVKKAIAPDDFYDYGIKIDDISFGFLEKGKFLVPGREVEIRYNPENP